MSLAFCFLPKLQIDHIDHFGFQLSCRIFKKLVFQIAPDKEMNFWQKMEQKMVENHRYFEEKVTECKYFFKTCENNLSSKIYVKNWVFLIQ
jgi:hypothetical protein